MKGSRIANSKNSPWKFVEFCIEFSLINVSPRLFKCKRMENLKLRMNSNSSKKGIPRFPWKPYPKSVSGNDDAILCDLFQTWVNIKCDHLNYYDCKYLQGCNKPWYCLSCTNTLFTFGNLNNQIFLAFFSGNVSEKRQLSDYEIFPRFNSSL